MDITSPQAVLTHAWGKYLTDPQVMLLDTTAYETDMRYPTEVTATMGVL